jgi:hypothetical protein
MTTIELASWWILWWGSVIVALVIASRIQDAKEQK